MGNKAIKNTPKKGKFTDEERFILAANSPAFLKKKEEAEAFLRRAGLPEWHPHYDKFKK